jgi:hypothetical protein
VTAPSITIVAIRAWSSIQIGTPAAASGSIPPARSHGVVLSAINLTSTPRCLTRTSASKMPVAQIAQARGRNTVEQLARHCQLNGVEVSFRSPLG